MRNRQVIEREMNDAREDLESSLSELRHVVHDKLDVKARARVAVEKGKQRANDIAVNGLAKAKFFAAKGKDGARAAYTKSRETVEERPVLIGSIALGVIALGAFIYIARKKEWI